MESEAQRKSFVEAEAERNAPANVNQIIQQMVASALQADVGGGQQAKLYASSPQDMVRERAVKLPPGENLSSGFKVVLQRQLDQQSYNGLTMAASRFQQTLEMMALILYQKAKQPKDDVSRLLDMQKIQLESTAAAWNHYADLDKIFADNRDYIGSPDRIPTMLKAVEGAMYQSLKDQRVGPDMQISPY